MPIEASKRKVSLQQTICRKQQTSRPLFQPGIDMDIAFTTLRRVRRARILRSLFAALIRSATFVGTCLLVVSFAEFLSGPLNDRIYLYPIGFATICCWCIVAIFRAPWSIRQTACWLDSVADTKSRFATILALRDQGFAGPWRSALLSECVKFAETFDPRKWTRPGMPQNWWMATAPWVGLLLLNFQDRVPKDERDPDGVLAQTSTRLEQMAVKSAGAVQDPQLRKLIDEMRKIAEQLRETRLPHSEAKRHAFEQLAKLDEILRRARDSQVTAAEMEALLNALAANDLTKNVEDLLREGKAEEAAQELERLAERLRDQSARKIRELAQSLQESMNRLSENEKSEVSRELQQSMQAAQGGNSEEMRHLMRQIAAMIREGRISRASKNGQMVRSTIRSLEDLKNALRNGSLQLAETDEPLNQTQITHFDQTGQIPGGPTGKPGDGGPADLSQKQIKDPLEAVGQAKKIQGIIGQGEYSLDVISSVGSTGHANREYRQLYDAVAPDNEQAIEQEEIPVGSRNLVKRYFERIRPKE
jgi:thermostable 8-oxoguanine DNA glycosylase